MLFNSFRYLVFFPIVVFLYFSLKQQRSQLALLLLSSCLFYAFFIPKYLLILFLVIAIDFTAGLMIEGSKRNSKRRRIWLFASLSANISILAVFKYSGFFFENLKAISDFLGWNLSLPVLQFVLPIGLSFHTFQSMAYILEVYQGRAPAERDWLTYSVYVLYFPQLVAGPIERPQSIIGQFKKKHHFNYEQAVQGCYLIAQGLLKKVCLADTLALSANAVFDHPRNFGILATLLGILSFSFQIYCDFSGYSDIARGSSQILGIRLMLNFNKPYFALSISEFWRRWHMSLSTWFRDYVYIPLGGSKKGIVRTSLNLMIVFALSGLWHGANWTFVIWGALHGVVLVCENTLLPKLRFSSWPFLVRRIYVWSIVFVAWVFFRAKNMNEALSIFSSVSRDSDLGLDSLPAYLVYEPLLCIAALLGFEAWDEKIKFWPRLRESRGYFRWAVYVGIVIVFLFTAQISGNQFIYFQF